MDKFSVAVFAVLICIETASAVNIDLTGDWLVGVGGQVICSWSFQEGDRLQSAKIYRDGRQLIVYRPEIHRTSMTEVLGVDNSRVEINCHMKRIRNGECVITVDPQEPVVEPHVFSCEVSGERPWFRLAVKEHKLEAFAASSGAQLEATRDSTVDRVVLNCSSNGLPAPEMLWVVGDRQVRGDFTGRYWNKTSKVWHSWSSVALTPSAVTALNVICAPEQRSVVHRDVVAAPSASYTLDMLSGRASISESSSILIFAIWLSSLQGFM